MPASVENRLEPIFEPLFSECSFGYRPGRSAHQAMRKIYSEIMDGCEWIVDADLRDFFGTVHHEPLINKIAEQVSDGRILKLVRQMLEAGYFEFLGYKLKRGKGLSLPREKVKKQPKMNIYAFPKV